MPSHIYVCKTRTQVFTSKYSSRQQFVVIKRLKLESVKRWCNNSQAYDLQLQVCGSMLKLFCSCCVAVALLCNVVALLTALFAYVDPVELVVEFGLVLLLTLEDGGEPYRAELSLHCIMSG